MKSYPRQGFTLIELMIVLAIIGILAAIGIPSLLQNRIMANESRAAASLKSYAVAQDIWRKGNFGDVPGNNFDYSGTADDRVTNLNSGQRSFADNFRNLYYAFPAANAQKRLALIPQAMADAFYPAGGNMSATAQVRLGRSAPAVERNANNVGDDRTATVNTIATRPVDGYVFTEDQFMETGDETAVNDQMGWNLGYGLLAYPIAPGSTGHNIYWIGFNQPVSLRGAPAASVNTNKPPNRLTVAESPLNPAAQSTWIKK